MSSQRTADDIENTTNSNQHNVKKISRYLEQLNNLSESAVQQLENTNDTVKVIQTIAMNTRILGFNASIEASRAKESGKGFGVIAQEVRSLADVSKSSAEKIEEIIAKITEITQEMHALIVEASKEVSSSLSTQSTEETD